MSKSDSSQITGDTKKGQIVQAAINVLSEKGIANTSLNDIVRESGVSKGGLYHHFANKDEVLVGVIDFFYQQYVGDLQPSIDRDVSAHQQLKCLLMGMEDLVKEMGEHFTLFTDFFTQATHNKVLQDRFKLQYSEFQLLLSQLVQLGINQKEFKKHLEPKRVASGLIAVFDGVGCAFMIVPEHVDYPKDALYNAHLLLDGLLID